MSPAPLLAIGESAKLGPAMSRPHPPPQRPPACVQAPLLPVLTALILVLLASQFLGPLPAAALALPTAATVALKRFMAPRPAVETGSTAVLLGLLIGIILAWRTGANPPATWQDRPPREVLLQLRVTEAFHARKPARIAGIARIHIPSNPDRGLSGQRVSFYLQTDSETPPPLALGESLLARACLTFLPTVKDPDDFQLYLLSRDIFFTLNQGHVLQRPRDPPAPERLRRNLYERCQRWLTAGCQSPRDPGYVLASMLLGNRGLLDDERIRLYKNSGTYHLFAVSGLHVGAVALCIQFLLRLLRLPPAWRVFPALAAVSAYVWLTGSAPSAVRAGIMISCLLASRHLLRQPHLFPALIFSATVVLIWSPRQLFHLGFQLSYAVVGAILLIGLPLARQIEITLHERWIPPPTRPAQFLRSGVLRLLQLLAVSSSASLASAPLIVQHFELFTPGGWLVAPLLGPLAAMVVFLGCAVFLLSPFSEFLGSLAARLGWPVVDAMEWLLQTILRAPGAVDQRQFAWPPSGTTLLLASLLLAWLLQQRRQRGFSLPAAAFFLPQILLLFGLTLATNST